MIRSLDLRTWFSWIAICPLDLYNLFSRIVIRSLNYTTRSLGLHCVNRGNELMIRENGFPIRGNGLHYYESFFFTLKIPMPFKGFRITKIHVHVYCLNLFIERIEQTKLNDFSTQIFKPINTNITAKSALIRD